ncbi:phosphotransferase enzyme family protein [Clostridium cellulovorans]|uniref:Aminoglycoside phosphotransferase n=1 Tax=Clostridium cellulovorans (strain ATCC 35296 / DSM 3052 / OCM 3 / 743B) TaxID=573061 RepID=D9SPK9_CLOC7|nr:phosphotransferase [Clostridium cellulovorans]ADL50058.1 aminoglycoside phosphotransferase [Clostridium cellulovorans 743B]
MDNLFPVEVSVVSSNELCDYITQEYFPNELIKCRLFYRGVHDIYKVIVGNKEFYFKVYRQGIRTMEEIQTEINLLNKLKVSGIEVAFPVGNCDGKSILQFNTVNGTRYGVLYTAVGIDEFDSIEETSKLNEKLGSYIASIHNAWDKCDPEICKRNLDQHLFIDNSMEAIRQFSNVHNFDIDFLEDVAKNLKKKLAALTTERPQYGICHGDIYSGNIRLDANNNPILFDFDFCGNGWRAYDISMYAFPFSMGSDVSTLKKREQRKIEFLNGYNKVRAMNESEVNSIAIFIPFRRIFNIGTLYISFLQNTWGDCAVIRNVDEDIIMLKKWLELNPIF